MKNDVAAPRNSAFTYAAAGRIHASYIRRACKIVCEAPRGRETDGSRGGGESWPTLGDKRTHIITAASKTGQGWRYEAAIFITIQEKAIEYKIRRFFKFGIGELCGNYGAGSEFLNWPL